MKAFAIGLLLIASLGCEVASNAQRGLSSGYTRGANIKSMIAMKQVAVALEHYRKEHGSYPSADSMEQLRSVLSAQLGDERGIDRWGQPLVVSVTPTSYVLTSKGDDKQGGHERGGAVDHAGHSITLEDGVFVQYDRSVESTARKFEVEIAMLRPLMDTDP